MAALIPHSSESSDEEQVTEDHLLRKCFSDSFSSRQLYVIMTGSFSLTPHMDCTEDNKLLRSLCRQGYLCLEEDEDGTSRIRIPNQHILDKFVKALTRHYQEEYSITQENIMKCSKSFVDLFSSLGKDDPELLKPLLIIKNKVQDMVSERAWSKIGNSERAWSEIDLIDIIFLPLLQTGFKCELWSCMGINILLYNKKCTVIIRPGLSQRNIAFDHLRSIYKINLWEVLVKKMPDGLEEIVVIALYFNTDNKSVTVLSSHERN